MEDFGSYFGAVCELLGAAWKLFGASWSGMAWTIRFWELISRILAGFWGFKIEEKSVQNDLKFEVLDGVTLGIIFLMVSVVFDGFQKTWIR